MAIVSLEGGQIGLGCSFCNSTQVVIPVPCNHFVGPGRLFQALCPFVAASRSIDSSNHRLAFAIDHGDLQIRHFPVTLLLPSNVESWEVVLACHVGKSHERILPRLMKFVSHW